MIISYMEEQFITPPSQESEQTATPTPPPLSPELGTSENPPSYIQPRIIAFATIIILGLVLIVALFASRWIGGTRNTATVTKQQKEETRKPTASPIPTTSPVASTKGTSSTKKSESQFMLELGIALKEKLR